MKILFLTHYYPPESNAPATRVSALAERWASAGHDVTVVTCEPNVPNGVIYPGYKNKWTVRSEEKGVHVIRIWSYIAPNKGTFLRVVNYLSYMLSAFFHCLFMKKPDVMIATSPQFFCGFAGTLLHWFRRFPFVLEIRDIWPESMVAVGANLPKSAISFLEWLARVMYRSSKHIVTVGPGYLEKLVEVGVARDKMSIIMNGVDKKMFFPHEINKKLLEEHGLKDKFVCSYIGTIGMACGLRAALDAAEILKQRKNDRIVIVLVGDGAIKNELQAEAQSRNLDNVVFTGRRPKSEMPDWVASSSVNLVHLKKTDLFKTVMPSKIFESAGCARPMIVGVEGFAKDLVLGADAGIAVEPENALEIADALEKLAANPELCEQMGKNALDNIASKYDRDKQADDYIEILEETIK